MDQAHTVEKPRPPSAPGATRPPLSARLEATRTGLLGSIAGRATKVDAGRVAVMFSHASLAADKIALTPALEKTTGIVDSQLNGAKALMRRLGVTDISKAPAITVRRGSLTLRSGHLNPDGAGFSPQTELVDHSVIIASTLDLTNTNLVIEPSVKQLTIIVSKLICGAGARITYQANWQPRALPQTTAQAGNSYNPAVYPGGEHDGPAGGSGHTGQDGAAPSGPPPAAPDVSIYALSIAGMPAIDLQGLAGAPGNPGQNGGNGGNGGMGINGSCIDLIFTGICLHQPGHGGNGGAGGHGGNGGRGGQGGRSGKIIIATTDFAGLLDHDWRLNIAGGPGGQHGAGGRGGLPGVGGHPGENAANGCDNAASWGGQPGQPGLNGAEGDPGRQGSDGVIEPMQITAAEWQAELTLPWLDRLEPSVGFTGTAVTALGLNVGAGDTVLVDGVAVTTTSKAANSLQFTIPATAVGGANTIGIKTKAGASSNVMNFTVLPHIAGSVSNSYTPGDTITLNGSGFGKNAQVVFTQPGASASNVVPSAASGTSVAFLVPPGTAGQSQAQGTATVVVINPDGEHSNILDITRLSFVANGFLPDPNGFAFVNPRPGVPTWGTYTDTFGSVEVWTSELTDPIMTSAFYGAYDYFLGEAVTGLCMGVSSGALNRFLQGETRAVDEAASPTPALLREFTVSMGRQLSGQLLTTFLGECINGQSQIETTLSQIEQSLPAPPSSAMPLIFFIPSGFPVTSKWFSNLNRSHCLVPYKLVRPLGWKGGYDGVQLHLYDCNYPKDPGCFLQFTETNGSLSFVYNKDNSVASSNDWTLGVLTMQQALYEGVDLPWLFGGAIVGYVVDMILSPATLSLTNLAGQTSGAKGDSIVAEISGVIPTFFTPHSLTMTPRALSLQRNIQGTGTGTYSFVSVAPADPTGAADDVSGLLPAGAISVVPGERSITLKNVACTASTQDSVLLGPDHGSVQITTTDANKSFETILVRKYDVLTSLSPTQQTSSHLQVLRVTGASQAAGEALTVWTDAAFSQLGVVNPGGAKALSVQASIVDLATGQSTSTQTHQANAAANSDLAVTIGDWKQLGSTQMAATTGALRALLPASFRPPVVH